MKPFFIADAARFENQSVTSYFLLASLSVRERKGGGQYLALTLADKTGSFEARMWDEFAESLNTCSDGCYVKVQGQVSKYQGKFQITIVKMRPAEESEVDPADFVPMTQYDIPTMAAELRGYVAAFRNAHLRALVYEFLDDPAIGPAFIAAPAAKRLHHAWIGGLLEHVLCLVRIIRAVAPFYPEADPELVVTGAILHDVGKVRELSWRNTFEYTLEGQLIGHISIAQGMLHEKIAALNARAAAAQFTDASSAAAAVAETGSEAAETKLWPALDLASTPEDNEAVTTIESPSESRGDTAPLTPFPDKLRLLLEHMILSHHGKLEFGSPKLPMTPEAMLLSALDDLEAKFQALRNEFAAAKAAAKPADAVTEWVRSMDRPLFNSQAWLEGQEPAKES